jgi:ribosomal protein S24E
LKIKITSENLNPLLKRKEIDFKLEHSDEGQTSSRLELKKKLADKLKVEPDLVFIEKVETKTGTMTAQGEANIYESLEQAKLVEREHIIDRNNPPTKEEQKEKPKAKPEEPKIEPKKETEEKTNIEVKEETEVKKSNEKEGEE